MRSIALYTLRPLDTTYSCYMTSLPAVLALWHAWVHIGSANCSNETPNVEMSVDNLLGV